MSPVVVEDPGDLGVRELIVLDPSEVAAGRAELALNAGPIRLAKEGPDWGEAQITTYMAEQQRGETPVDFRIPNRQVKLALTLGADGPADFDVARAALQAKAALFQRHGGTLKRETRDGRRLFLDVVNATLVLPEQSGWLGVEADVVLTLEALPDFYGDEIEA